MKNKNKKQAEIEYDVSWTEIYWGWAIQKAIRSVTELLRTEYAEKYLKDEDTIDDNEP